MKTSLAFLFLTLQLSLSIQATTLTVHDFAGQRNIIDARISPNGEYLAMTISQNNSRFLVIRNLTLPNFPVTGLLEDPVVRPATLSWANNDRLIVELLVPFQTNKVRYKHKNQADFNIHDYLMFKRSISIDVKAKNVVQLMENKNHFTVGNLDLGWISNILPSDPKHIQMPAWIKNKLTLNKVNIYTGDASTIATGNQRTFKFITDASGTPTHRLDYLKRAKEIQVFKLLDKNRWTKVDSIYFNPSDEESTDSFGLLYFGIGKDSELIYRKRSIETGFYEIVSENRGTNQSKVIASLPNQSIHSLIQGQESSHIIGYRVQTDILREYYFDKGHQDRYDAIAAQLGPVNFGLYSPIEQGKKATLVSYGLTNPGSLYTFDFESDKLDFVGQLSQNLPLEKLAKSAMTSYSAKDGTKIRAYILFPPKFEKSKPMPLVVIPHGGPNVRDSATYDRLAQFISTRGYIVIKPNFRGSTGYGLKFEEQGYRQWGELMQSDIDDAVRYMITNKYAIKDKVCILGGSFGGYAALAATIKDTGLYSCAVSINGISNIKDIIEHTIEDSGEFEQQVKARVFQKIGHPERDSGYLDRNSPELHADKVKIPILLITGEKDEIVPRSQSEKMVDALDDAGATYKYIELQDVGHNPFASIKSRTLTYQAIEEFLAVYLK